ncbi:endonuclease/exonuclease/phosphatase family protein [Botrimarina hoheduenensis]|uniref:Endonuclease/Exonuclease/phosphatase family protein n=1 Tax=Botrimarina hoheduenensis TaxID=2528000 RepID=A0A5C5WGK5_9BACT|nr:endonuclease/exonuclease/phosphatase family protein [Botrimarina hoheduenensis]TWT48912.1 Endonuclease/Exonuclease/phosphatase family protein [Botrimarina hoheduenensis]
MNRTGRFPLSAALLTLTILAGLAPAKAAETTAVRIVTFNAEILTAPGVRAGQLQKYRFNQARDAQLDRVADLIEVLTPDVLNLVEVTSVEAVDALISRLHDKGLKDYRGYHIESHDNFSGMDVALITRLPIDEVEGQPIRTIWSEDDDPTWNASYSFTNWDGDPDTDVTSLGRNSLYYLTIAGHKLGFLGLHLKSNPDEAYSNAKRMAEVEVARRIVRSQIVGKGYLPVVLGDLNDYDPAVPDRDDTRDTKTEALAKLKDFDPERPGEELVNVAKKIVNKEDRYTSHWDRNENGAGDGDDVYTMIDHILLPKAFEPYIRRAFIAHVVGLETSDHFPVVVDLALPPATATR